MAGQSNAEGDTEDDTSSESWLVAIGSLNAWDQVLVASIWKLNEKFPDGRADAWRGSGVVAHLEDVGTWQCKSAGQQK